MFCGSNTSLASEFANLMKTRFEMSLLGTLKYFLGLQIAQTSKGIFISQQKYASELLKKFNMKDSKSVSTPLCPNTKLSVDCTSEAVPSTLYRSIIGNLLYLIASRPDIMYSVGLVARFQSNPKMSHLQAAKRILRYVKGTISYCLHYIFSLIMTKAVFSDVDWVDPYLTKRVLLGAVIFLVLMSSPGLVKSKT
ncbi:uncharacterized mitochondrial protein AtMg00810-like [Cornus florida]|uniref:uncharacterized mitochondrial protein AtMg00810-like n=1 Tax=Cornus florida TaxID=4283 RepID=UPI00289DBA08|nr:uncharacterized mitochondrial protein AtMg00810-like [Cornus florida]